MEFIKPSLDFIFIVLIIIVLFYEIKSFLKTRSKIIEFTNLIPSNLNEEVLRITNQEIAATEIPQLSYIDDNKDDNKSEFIEKLINPINDNLKTNKGVVNLDLVKDIIDVEYNHFEDYIRQAVSFPLFLGLFGTMCGIVVSLFGLNIQNLSADTNQISGLVFSVSFAMISSACGLILTVKNLSDFNKTIEDTKTNRSKFLDFIRQHLIPVLPGIESTFNILDRNLNNFNETFKSNIDKFDNIINEISNTFVRQEVILEALNKIKIDEIASANVTVSNTLLELNKEFEKFETYLNNINTYVESSEKLVATTNTLFEKFNNFSGTTDTILNEINNRIGDSKKLIEFLNSHFENLENSKKAIDNSVVDVDSVIQESLRNLKEHTNKLLIEIENTKIDEVEAFREALRNHRQGLDNLVNLEELFKYFKDTEENPYAKLLQDINSNIGKISNEEKSYKPTAKPDEPKDGEPISDEWRAEYFKKINEKSPDTNKQINETGNLEIPTTETADESEKKNGFWDNKYIKIWNNKFKKIWKS